MSNQTAAREYVYHASTDSIAQPALVNTTYYRGTAVVVPIEHATAAYVGRLSTILNGTILGNFIGVVPRTQGSSTGAYDAKIALQRGGAVLFDAVSSAGAAATPGDNASSWNGKTVWFYSNHEVCLTPIGLYPVLAGRVIACANDVGWGDIGATQVLVEIDNAVRNPQVNWSLSSFAANISALNNTAQVVVNAYTWARRTYVGRAIVQIGQALAGGTPDLTILMKNGSTALTNLNNAAVNTLTAGAMQAYNASTVYDIDDTLTISLSTTQALTAGFVNVILEHLAIQ